MSTILGLNPKDFTHVSSDDKTTTLKHKKGHEIKIAHSVLSPTMRKQLEALKPMAGQDATSDQKQESQDSSQYGKVIMKNKGGEIKDAYQGNTPGVSNAMTLSPSNAMADGGRVRMDVGGKVPVPSSPDSGAQDKQQYAQNLGKAEKTGTSDSETSKAAGYVSNPSSLVDTIKHAWAKGGQIETCKSCGGPIHRKAMFGGGDPAGDIAGVQQIIPKQSEDSPLSLDMAAKRKQYNDIVAGHNAGFFGDPQDMSGVSATKNAQFGANDEPPKQFDPQAWNQMENEREQSKQASANQVASEAMKTAEYNKAAQSAGLPAQPTDDISQNQDTNGAAPQDQSQASPQDQGQTQGQSAPQDQGQNQGQSGLPTMGGYNAATNEMAAVEQHQLGQQIQAKQQAMDTYQNTYAELENERKAHIQDIQNGYIDPDKYWDSHSKVATGIGMILAGFNPSSKPNAAIDFLNNQINRSVESQKANLSAKNNLLAANLQHFGDLHQATLMTQAMLNDQLAAKMQQAGLQSKNPLVKQAALGAQNTMMQQSMMFQQQLAMRSTMMKLANGAGTPETQAQAIAMMSAVNPEGAKVYRDAFVPGVGMSKSLNPIPEEVRQQIASGQKLQNATQDLLSYSAQHTNINPMSAEYKVGTQKALILQQMVREGMLGTVFRDSEKPLLNAFVAENPASALKRINSDPKLRTLLESSVSQLNTLKSNYGLPTQNQPQQQQAPQYKTVNGVKYMRGPNGQAVQVK